MTETDKAYIAGLIDGEGYIGIYRESKTQHLRSQVRVEMQDKEIIEWLHRVGGAGGTVQSIRRPNRQYLTYAVKWSQKPAIALLKEIVPYLKVKKRQAEAFIEFDALSRVDPNRDLLYMKIAQLKIDGKDLA